MTQHETPSIHEDAGLIPGPAMSCGIGHRLDLGPELLWLWPRLAATALIRPLALELPYAVGAALRGKKKKKTLAFDIKTCICLHFGSLEHLYQKHGCLFFQ